MRIPSTEAPSGEFRAAPLFPFALPADTPAEQFAGWLPYSAYLAEEKLFVNRDGMGFLLEVMPQSGADERMAEVLVSLYANCPPDTGLQFHLFASPHIRHQLRQYTNLREQARATAENKPFKVVLISTQLPDIEGFDLAEAILSAAAPPPCIVMLAGEGRRGDGARCREMGISAYLPMPIMASDLLNAILLSVEPIDDNTGNSSSADRSPLITRHSLREQKRQLRILLAEDNVVNQTLALRLLGKLGHQADVANNGKEALELHARNRYDLVLMDVQMPIMGGFDATAQIRQREAAGATHTPIVAMTAHAMKGDRERCLAAGMDGYLSKPVHAPDLVEVLIQHTGRGDPAPPPPSEPTSISGPVFERQKVLFNLGGDEELLEQLIGMFIEDEPRLFADIEAAVVEGDAEALHNAAHALKGAVSNFCAGRAQTGAAQLERIGREKRMADAPQALEALRAELAALREAFAAA